MDSTLQPNKFYSGNCSIDKQSNDMFTRFFPTVFLVMIKTGCKMSTTGGWLNEARLSAQWNTMQLSKGQAPFYHNVERSSG